MKKILWFIIIIILLAVTPATFAQDDEGEFIELLPPDYVSENDNFGIALPDGYMAFRLDDEVTRVLTILGDEMQPTAAISIEDLPEDVSDVAAFWQIVKNRDPWMKRNLTYEMVTSFANTGAIQSRTETMEGGQYFLALTWVFVKDGKGYSVSAYSGPDFNVTETRDLGTDLKNQFRFMTDEEIDEYYGIVANPSEDEETE